MKPQADLTLYRLAATSESEERLHLLDRIVERARAISRADAAYLLFAEPGNSPLALESRDPWSDEPFPLVPLTPALAIGRGEIQPVEAAVWPISLIAFHHQAGHRLVRNLALVSHAQVLGLLQLAYRRPRMGSAPDRLRSLGELAALLLENGLADRRLRRECSELSAVREISQAILTELDLRRLLALIAEKAGLLTSARTVSVSLVSEDGEHRHHLAVWGFNAASLRDRRFPALSGLQGRVIRERRALLFPEAAGEPEALREILDGFQARSMMAAPFLIRGRLLGVLAAYHERPAGFRPADLSALDLLAQEVSVAIANAQAYARAQALAHTDPATGLSNHRFFHQRLTAEMERSRRYGRPCSLIFIDLDDFKAVNDTYGHRTGDRVLRQLAQVLRPHARPVDTLARYGGEEFVLLQPEMAAAEALTAAEDLRQAVAEATFGGPEHDLRLTASLGVASYPEQAETAETLLLLADQSMYLAKGLGRNRVQTAADLANPPPLPTAIDWRRGLREKVQALAAGRGGEQPATWEHSEAVSRWAGALAERLGLAPTEVEAIALAGLLHDIGKMKLPETLLTKAAPLSPAEWAQIREHPRYGREILSGGTAIAAIIPMVYHHQERWDGSGYPVGLAGEKIPLGARIIAVADAFAAMVADRPYRRALSLLQATAEIRKNSGSMFDPRIAAAFLELPGTGVEDTAGEEQGNPVEDATVTRATSRKVDH